MSPDLKKAILDALAKDREIKNHHLRTVVLHLTEEQYEYLRRLSDESGKRNNIPSRQKKTWRGLGWFMRRLLIIDMVRRNHGG